MTTDDKPEDINKRWVEVAALIKADPKAEVLCPACDASHLAVQDSEPVDGKMERVLSCEKCGALVFIRMEEIARGDVDDALEAADGGLKATRILLDKQWSFPEKAKR
jgi:hypothetical protein